nr:hypothetical protein CFP56_03249 [Quercus suber]
MSGLQASQSILDSPAYKAVSQYIQSQDASSGDAQAAFCQPVEDSVTSSFQSSGAEDQLWQLWKGVISLAASTSDDGAQQRLVDFVLSVAQRPDVQQNDQVSQVQDMTLWRDLPIFGWQLRDSWNNAATDDDSAETIQQWINLNAFTARFVASARASSSSSSTNDLPDESLYAIWTLRSGLEEQQQPSNAALAAAAVWVIHAASALEDFSQQGKVFDGKVAKPGSLFNDEDWRGFTKDRWRTWGQRFSDVQGSVQDGTTQALVEQARKAMGEVKER